MLKHRDLIRSSAVYLYDMILCIKKIKLYAIYRFRKMILIYL